MNIIIANELFRMQGGTETISIHTYNLLKNKGHKVYFFASDDGKEYFEKSYKYSKYFPKHKFSLKSYIKNPILYYWDYEASKNLRNMILDVKPDIVHFNLPLSPSVIDICHKMNIPTVMTLHSPTPLCPASTFMLSNKYLCKDFKCKNGNYWNCIINNCKNNSLENSVRKALLSYIYKQSNAYSKLSALICCSDTLKEYCLKSNVGLNKNNIVTINNFLTNDELTTIPNYSNKGYFLYIGRLCKEKGVHYLLEAMKDLPRDIKLHIVGIGKEEKYLKQYAKDNNLDNIEFCGFKNREEIKEEYQNCLATILPCNWFENFPTTNMESFINGKPVIASNIGGIPEQVEHNKTGLLFEPANVEQLKECILKYRNNPEVIIEHGKNAYQKAVEKYSEERYYKELMNVYKEAINAKNQY